MDTVDKRTKIHKDLLNYSLQKIRVEFVSFYQKQTQCETVLSRGKEFSLKPLGTFFHPINDDDSFFSPLSLVSAGSEFSELWLGVRLGMHRGEYALKWGSFFTTRAGSQWGSRTPKCSSRQKNQKPFNLKIVLGINILNLIDW